ncbi:MAG: hypothetical protein K8H88_23405, partial [Sandaracinaceae bacterium]|nr:hypothetical protein [Sandaracinaceae bacterium]
PDVLVVDLELKDGRGDELADRVCAELGERAPAVLICTGEERQGPGVLCKPFRAQDLVEAVAAIMRGRKPITSHRLG